MRNHLPPSPQQSLNLDPHIQIQEVKDERQRVQFRFIRFNLDRDVLDRILLARATGRRLYVGRRLLAELRSYALVDGERQLQSGLTFCTYYSELRNAQLASENILMRSVISLDGDIIHQVRRDCLEDAQRCKAIATAHHWLIDQLLNRLPLVKTGVLLQWLSWGLSLLLVVTVVIIYAVYAVNFEPINSLYIVLAAIALWLLLYAVLQRLLGLFLRPVRAWAFRKLLRWLLSSKLLEKKLAKSILERFVP